MPYRYDTYVSILNVPFVFQGCEVKDHIVRLEELSDGQTAPNKVYDDLLAYRQAVAIEVKPHKPSTQYVHVTSEVTCFNAHMIP